MSAKSKKSAAKKKNEKLKKKQAAKIARKAVIEKKAAADPSFKIKLDKKELAAQKKAEKREKKLQKKRELAKKKKQDLKPEKKPAHKKKQDQKPGKKDKTGGQKGEAQAPPKEDTPKEKKHKGIKQPAAREPGALLEAGSAVASTAQPASGFVQQAPEPDSAGRTNEIFERPDHSGALPDEEETTVIDEVLEETRITGYAPAEFPSSLPDDSGTAVNENACEAEETSQPQQAVLPVPITGETQRGGIEAEREDTDGSGQTDETAALPIPEETTVIEQDNQEPGADAFQPLPSPDVAVVYSISESAEPQPPSSTAESPASDTEPAVFSGFQQGTAAEPVLNENAPQTETQPVLNQDESRRWLAYAQEQDVQGPLDEVLPNSALGVHMPAEPAEKKQSEPAEPRETLATQSGGDITALPFDTLKYTSPQTDLPQPPAQTPQSARHGKKAGDYALLIGKRIALMPVTVMSLSLRLYSFLSYQISKVKRLSRKARMAALAVCLLAAAAVGAGLLYGQLHYEIPPEAKPVYGGVNIRAADLRDIDEIPPEQQLAKADATKARGDKDVFTFFALTDIVISEPADNLPIVLGNLKKNNCTFIISLVDRDGRLMARTLGLPPGKYLPYITLIDQRLPYGEYDRMKLVVSAYDSDTLAYLGSQYTDFRLVIGIENEAGTATPGQ